VEKGVPIQFFQSVIAIQLAVTGARIVAGDASRRPARGWNASGTLRTRKTPLTAYGKARRGFVVTRRSWRSGRSGTVGAKAATSEHAENEVVRNRAQARSWLLSPALIHIIPLALVAQLAHGD
jgi:hypothetical protein